MFETPILFQTFARVEYARKVWESIKDIKPRKLYFYSNKGRAEKAGEIERNEEIRSWVKEIDWDCELHTWFREECVDVYTSLKGATSWLFEHEEQGIILEDDIVPTRAFYSFVEQMLNKFKNNKNVWYVSGDNFYDLNPSGTDYIFSRYHWMYGWATWRDRWNSIKWGDFDLQKILDNKVCYELYKTKQQARNRENQILSFREMLLKTNDWDYAFGLTVDYNKGVGVFPKKHLIHNIGLSGENHAKPIKTFVNIEPTYKDDTYIIINEPKEVEADIEFDYQYYRIRKKAIPLYFKLCKKIIRLFLSENTIQKIKKKLGR